MKDILKLIGAYLLVLVVFLLIAGVMNCLLGGAMHVIFGT
jgi:hypothetical protein